MNLTSQKTGNILMIFLIISIVVGALYMLTTYFFAYHYDEVYLSIAEWDQIIMSADSIIWIVACIIFLIWIYMVHVDLKKVNPDYPITPLGSFARILIPFYNIYGFWHVFSTMSSYFKEHNKTIDLGKKLAFMIPCYYIMIFSSQALHRILGNGLIVSDNMIMLSSISDFMLGVVCFFMARYILKAILIIEPEPTEEQIPS